MNQEVQSQFHTIDNELDIIELVRFLVSKWKIYSITIVIGFLLSLCYTFIVKPEYRAWASFFVPESETSTSLFSSYTQILGASGVSDKENKIIAIFQSKRLQDEISKDIYKAYPELAESFEKKFGKKLPEQYRYELFSKHKLGLKAKLGVSKDKTGLIKLSYDNKSTEVALSVINMSLMAAHSIYELAELSGEKEIMKMVDYPQVQYEPVKPRPAMNAFVGIMLGFFAGIGIILVKHT